VAGGRLLNCQTKRLTEGIASSKPLFSTNFAENPHFRMADPDGPTTWYPWQRRFFGASRQGLSSLSPVPCRRSRRAVDNLFPRLLGFSKIYQVEKRFEIKSLQKPFSTQIQRI
jgi:hypothetical protein